MACRLFCRASVLSAFILIVCAQPSVGQLQPDNVFEDDLTLLVATNFGTSAIVAGIIRAGRAAGVDPRLLFGIARIESQDGFSLCATNHQNPFGWPTATYPACLAYASIPNAATDVAGQIARNMSRCPNNTPPCGQPGLFAGGHTTVDVLEPYYCIDTDPVHCGNWVSAVDQTLTQLFGNPNLPLYYSSSCPGDCNRDNKVDVNEIVLAIDDALCWQDGQPVCGSDTPPICYRADANNDWAHTGTIEIDDLIKDVNSFLFTAPDTGACP